MTCTAVGICIPALGLARQLVAEAGGHVGFQTRTRYFGIDPEGLRPQQGERIRIDLEHDESVTLGEVVHLELRHSQAWAVASMHGEPPATREPLYWSVHADHRRDGGDVVVKRIAVTRKPAMTMASPIVFLPGELSGRAAVEAWHVEPHVREVLRNAVQELRTRARGEALWVRGATSSVHDVEMAEQRPAGPLWHSAPVGKVLRVT